MRAVLKIILFPIFIFLSVLTAILKFIHGIGSTILYILMIFCILGAIACLSKKTQQQVIQALIIGFFG